MTLLLIDLTDRKSVKGALYAFFPPAAASPVYKADTRMIKRAAGAPGDVELYQGVRKTKKSCISVPPATDLSWRQFALNSE